jgi:hypothetical protein
LNAVVQHMSPTLMEDAVVPDENNLGHRKLPRLRMCNSN